MMVTTQIGHQGSSEESIRAVILSDGKAGHYNQSLGVIQNIPDCDYHWVEIKFQSKRRDNILRVLMRIFGGCSLPDWFIKRLLRVVLQPETWTEISTVKRADLILSTGSSVAAVNLLVGQLFNAKTVTCRRPSPVGTTYFDLAILPKMYWPHRDKKNICETIGVPNAVSPEKLNARRKQLQTDLALTDRRRIGVLIGGEDRYDTITEGTALRLIDVLQRVVAKLDCQILLTTSRRTPTRVVEVIDEHLSDPNLCPICVLAARDSQIAHPVEAIFALSDLILVTEDSFSMVCEAASSGRRVIILEVDHKTRHRPKRCQVYTELMRHASVEWCDIKDLLERIPKALADRSPIKSLCDTRRAANAVVQLL